MALLSKDRSNSVYTPPEEGTHLGICSAVVGVGLQKTSWGTEQEQVWIRFEIPAERVEYEKDGTQVNVPQTIWKRYNNTLNKKSTLRKDLDSWRGRQFTEAELQGFELFNLVGKPCLLTVVHNHTADRTYANVTAITRVMRGQEVPSLEMDPIRFGPDDTDQYPNLPEWLKDKFDQGFLLEKVVKAPVVNDEIDEEGPEDVDS